MMIKGARQFGRHRVRGGPMAKTIKTHDYTFGAIPQGDGTVRFRLWAPAVEHVVLAIEGHTPVPMIVCADGSHELRCPCPVGARYRYQLSSGLMIADPASRQQFGDVQEASVVVDTRSYEWLNTQWHGRPWTETVLYEIHVGLAGGFRGVQERLADLADLGVTAIELMPIGEFPGERSWGYDGVFPYAPDCSYGSPNDLMQLVDTAHGMGMMVFLDVFYNHFGPEGNSLPLCAPEFFRADQNTPWGQGVDFRHPQVRAFFTENALYWLREYRFDGLRLDAAHAMQDEGWLTEMAHAVRSQLEPERHIHLVVENDDNRVDLLTQGYDAQWNDDAHHVLHHILTGEEQGYYSAYVDDPTSMLATVLSQGFVYQGQASVNRQGRPRGEPSAQLPPTAFVFFLQNHDQVGNRVLGKRLVTLCAGDPQRLLAAVALQLLTPHIPLLFVGEEYGISTPFQYFTDFKNPVLADAVREGRHREFAAFPEFSDVLANQNIPDPNDIQTWENSRPQYDMATDDEGPAQWRAWYAHLLGLRRQWITPYLPDARSVSATVVAKYAVIAQWRLGNGSMLSIYCNLSDQDVVLTDHAISPTEHVILDSSGHQDINRVAWSLPAASTIVTIADSAQARP